jgi:hypothetical protein
MGISVSIFLIRDLRGTDSHVDGIADGDAAGEFFEIGAADEIGNEAVHGKRAEQNDTRMGTGLVLAEIGKLSGGETESGIEAGDGFQPRFRISADTKDRDTIDCCGHPVNQSPGFSLGDADLHGSRSVWIRANPCPYFSWASRIDLNSAPGFHCG